MTNEQMSLSEYLEYMKNKPQIDRDKREGKLAKEIAKFIRAEIKEALKNEKNARKA